MAKKQKLIVCRNCNNTMPAGAKICPTCGAKNKKPFLKNGWIVLLVIIVIIAIAKNGGSRKKTNTSAQSESTMYVAPEVTAQPEKTEPTPKPAETTTPEETETEEVAEEAEETQEEASALVDGMRPEFKEAMDSYEAFYTDYCDFLEQYQENPADLTLIAEYAEMVTKLSEMDESFDEWENTDLNDAEMAYYLEVNTRVAEMLLAIGE